MHIFVFLIYSEFNIIISMSLAHRKEWYFQWLRRQQLLQALLVQHLKANRLKISSNPFNKKYYLEGYII